MNHIVRHKDPGPLLGGFTPRQRAKITWRTIHHPVYDPEPMKKRPSMWARAIAWALTLFSAP